MPLRLAFALAVAMLLNTYRRGVSVYRAAYYAPSVVAGSVAVAVMWRQVFGTEGVINAVLALLGIPPVRWLGDPDLAIWTLIETEDCAAVSLEMADGSLCSLSVTVGSSAEISRHRFCFENLTAESNLEPYRGMSRTHP